MTKNQFKAVFEVMLRYYNKEPETFDPKVMEKYFQKFRHCEIEIFAEACDLAMRAINWLPKIAELDQYVLNIVQRIQRENAEKQSTKPSKDMPPILVTMNLNLIKMIQGYVFMRRDLQTVATRLKNGKITGDHFKAIAEREKSKISDLNCKYVRNLAYWWKQREEIQQEFENKWHMRKGVFLETCRNLNEEIGTQVGAKIETS